MAAASSTQLALHLADRALTPIISSSRQPSSNSPAQTRSQAQALSSLTTTAVTAYESASRLGLGVPERIMIETHSSGPIVLHSYLSPLPTQRPRSRRTQSRDSGDGVADQSRAERPTHGSVDNRSVEGQGYEVLVNGVEELDIDDAEEAGNDSVYQPPLLIASVVAPSSADSGEARRAAARLERTGRTFQREWIRLREQDQSRQLNEVADEDDR
ncbi:uncharacterized protein LY89DRAFT_668326 [Mollisia scopiformis]|uniref:Uncharacterized protein n=1 Tax=Mollisia scopiformis TaxID=149040 RepID=A0A194XD93_MOLSC|nr:uncharacterized protein LY89DRAFT_668326 [Mollisia scopiformis]KUJ18143.1 hypothetical protein LY89DRAFT_668326 [Mollisia scopiformis]